MRLKDKVALITGTGRGIGRAAAEVFAREGARVVIAEIDEALGRGAEDAIRTSGGEAVFVRTDVADSGDVQQLMARTRDLYGRLDVLYNNASVFLGADDGSATELDEAVWQRVLRVNLDSVFLCSKYGIPLMIASRGGSAINTGSSASVMGIPGCDAYTATKGATLSLTRSMAVAYGPKGVRVNCICPAGIATEMVKQSSLDDPGFDAEYFFKRAPLGRLGEPAEVAKLALFLASDESSYVNGAILRADGGITITPIS
jgi:NAD(P)-dependent dehydrogenase (short-subunit alcohol dehydrogenase family)